MSLPTPEEFIHCRNKELDDVVKTVDGRLFKVENSKLINGWRTAIKVLTTLSFSAIILVSNLKNNAWPALQIDMYLVTWFFSWLAFRLLYYRARFAGLEPGTNEYEAASEAEFKKPYSRLVFIALGIGILAVFLHSFTFTYIRSLIYNEARIESVKISDSDFEIVLNTDSDPASVQTIYVPAKHSSSYFDIDVTTVCTPARTVLTIDGKPFTGITDRDLYLNWFWDADYFRQHYWFSPEYADIHDGSTLALTCGSLHREDEDVVITEGRYFYLYDATRPVSRWLIAASYIFFPVTLTISLLTGIWENIIFDFSIVALIIQACLLVWRYRRLRFIEVEQGTDEYWSVSHIFKPKRKLRVAAKKACYALILLTMLFFAANSLCALGIRSLAENNVRFTSVCISMDNADLYNSDENTSDTLVYLPGSGTLYADVSTMYTPLPVRLYLDGSPLRPSYISRYASFIWQNDYSKRYQYFKVSGTDLRDGSTLTLTCGSLHREWTLHTRIP